MKKDQVPQDLGALGKLTKEVCYATDEQGKYTTALSNGWEVKTEALDITWENIQHKVEAARAKVLNNEASPILYFMEKSIMDLNILSSYTGFYKWQIKRHLKPAVFNKLSPRKLNKYAEVFNVSVEGLKKMEAHDQ